MKHLKEIQKYWPSAHDFDPLPLDYASWSAQTKQEFLWQERILASSYKDNPPLKRISIVGLFLTPLRVKMDRLVDEAPPRWRKAIHAHGSVAQIKFTAVESPYSGLFKGVDFGLLRASLTGEPSDRGFAPGLAFKFFIDGQPSGNFSALVSLSGQGKDYNFFANEFSNIVPPVNELGPLVSNTIFRRVTRYPTRLYLQHLGKYSQNGKLVPHPQTPIQLFLEPNPDLQFSSTPHDFRVDLQSIEAGTPLFSIYASQNQDVEIGTVQSRQRAQQIGHIETTSPFISSFYGDSQLFYRHQRFRNQ